MKAPDKIFAAIVDNRLDASFLEKSIGGKKFPEYIRKDLLLEWLKEKIRDYWADDENTMGIYPYALEEVINKLNSL